MVLEKIVNDKLKRYKISEKLKKDIIKCMVIAQKEFDMNIFKKINNLSKEYVLKNKKDNSEVETIVLIEKLFKREVVN